MASMEVDLTQPRKLDPAEFIVPPDWAVRLVSTNFGKAGRKYPLGWTQTGSYSHIYPGMPDDYPWGMGGAGDHSGGYEEHWRRREREENKTVMLGNLKEEQYRFWNGSPVRGAEVATCRWCKYWAYGQAAMQLHQSKTDHTRILRDIYNCARNNKLKRCFACGSQTSKERWGIPLCHTNRCLNKWRTAPIGEISTTLLFYAKWAKSKGLLKEWLNEDGSEKRNFDSNSKPFNWTSASAY